MDASRLRSCFLNGGNTRPGCKRQRHVVGKRLRPARRWIGPIHSKRRGNGGQPPKIPRAWKDSAHRRALPCHRSCFRNGGITPPGCKRQRHAVWEMASPGVPMDWADLFEAPQKYGHTPTVLRVWETTKAVLSHRTRQTTILRSARRQRQAANAFAHPWVLYAGKALSAFAEVSPHAVDFACAQNKGAAGEEAMKEIPPKGGWASLPGAIRETRGPAICLTHGVGI